MREGIKIWTSRTRRYGKPGDQFVAFNTRFVIESVEKKTLEEILSHWKEEGCDSREDAENLWKTIHPLRKFDLKEQFFTHIFRKWDWEDDKSEEFSRRIRVQR
jgi:hypothetical protein